MGEGAGAVSSQRDMNASMGTEDPKEIEARIEQTRAEMSETIDAIQERLDPERLRQQVTESVREATVGRTKQMANEATRSARGFTSNMMETIRQNPLPAALAGIGIGWLVMKGSSDTQRREMRYYQTRGQAGEMASEARARAGRMADQAQHQAEELTGEVRHRAMQMADQAQHEVEELASEARHRATQMADQAQYQAERTTDRLQQMMQDNPLAVGALALAVGAAVGLVVPETQQERELMGEARDTFMERAQETAEETVHKVQRVAEEAQRAAQQAAEKEAKEQGLAE